MKPPRREERGARRRFRRRVTRDPSPTTSTSSPLATTRRTTTPRDDGDGDGDEEEGADEEPGESDEGAVAVLAGVMTPEADDAAALLAKAVGALIAKIESNTATRTSLVIRAEEIDAQNEELGRTIEVMTATIDTLRGQKLSTTRVFWQPRDAWYD